MITEYWKGRYNDLEEFDMVKSRQRTARKPATKFAQLKKKMQKRKSRSKKVSPGSKK